MIQWYIRDRNSVRAANLWGWVKCLLRLPETPKARQKEKKQTNEKLKTNKNYKNPNKFFRFLWFF